VTSNTGPDVEAHILLSLLTTCAVRLSTDILVVKNVQARSHTPPALAPRQLSHKLMGCSCVYSQVRLMLALIHSPLLTLLAASVQLPNNLFNDERDRLLYRCFRRLSASQASIAQAANDPCPTRIPRNRTLKLRLLHVETTIEIICTAVAVRESPHTSGWPTK
jgi:hypothetical protein